MKENKGMTPILDINIVSCGEKLLRIYGFKNNLKRRRIDKFAQSEFAIVQFAQRHVLLVVLLCFSLFQSLVS